MLRHIQRSVTLGREYVLSRTKLHHHGSSRLLIKSSFYCTYTASNYYEALGLKPSATQAQIKAAYYKLSKKHHPDRNKGSKVSQERFAKVNEAYSILGSVTLRKRYDRGILSQRDTMTRQPPPPNASYTQTYTQVNEDESYAFRFQKNTTQRAFDDFLKKHYKASIRKTNQDKRDAEELQKMYIKRQEEAETGPQKLIAFSLLLSLFGFLHYKEYDTRAVSSFQNSSKKNTKHIP